MGRLVDVGVDGEVGGCGKDETKEIEMDEW